MAEEQTPGDPDALVARALARPPRLGSGRLVAVDGPAGSGKTTLASALADACGRQGLTPGLIHLDDLYDGWETDFDELAARVEQQLLAPLSCGADAAWHRYDWHAGRFDEWVPARPSDLLVLEGCGAGARPLASYTSLLVWVEADPDERVRRGVARDGEQVLPDWLAWTERETAHFAAADTRARADVRLTT